MKQCLFLIIAIFFLMSCEDYSHSKFYDFKVDNELSSSVIKIVPLTSTESDFWLVSTDTIVVIPGERIIIGSRYEYDDNKKVVDLFDAEDNIESFDLYIDNVKSDIDFSKRKHWTFEAEPVDESATYLLTINEETILID